MPVLLFVLVIGGIAVFLSLRTQRTAQDPRASSEDGGPLPQRGRPTLLSVAATPLEGVRDVRLAAVILMIQLVRTGDSVSAAETARILALMRAPLEIEAVADTYERAFGYTDPHRPFSLVADPLLPLFREALTEAERLQFVEMLASVAEAEAPASDLQREALVRLKRRLLASLALIGANRAGDA
ncbi:hypothetical protein [Methylobacterium sp. Leaf108]|uniref:hypothetical protein n=1 Tax=Methylobacterium sp. Leaf108 TaxID=1736256 RepID=UPI0006FC5796|nr:hypothetical protein [Methylobacterium sp. Leaf108]KQP54179.1 hypothetical protein ASF39_19580 [Methylobacterium sp. Leaf108]